MTGPEKLLAACAALNQLWEIDYNWNDGIDVTVDNE